MTRPTEDLLWITNLHLYSNHVFQVYFEAINILENISNCFYLTHLMIHLTVFVLNKYLVSKGLKNFHLKTTQTQNVKSIFRTIILEKKNPQYNRL